ncbi:hypothetical protein [Geomesophilobacter sediminis]|uniref:Uncharacterized protein n=1 Tax=Geomesophilobacter sediminis TaxID=2798584 RepID=A0A8J7JEF1_9BACT|nr:hypothetical protein [Geomesophilobacter sediminis]MBJ6725646.1 hypothetical protein [Geomesophilobacter sediminis]
MDATVQKAIVDLTQLKQSMQNGIGQVNDCIEGLRSGKMRVVDCTETIEKMTNVCRNTLINVERLLPEEEDV